MPQFITLNVLSVCSASLFKKYTCFIIKKTWIKNKTVCQLYPLVTVQKVTDLNVVMLLKHSTATWLQHIYGIIFFVTKCSNPANTSSMFVYDIWLHCETFPLLVEVFPLSSNRHRHLKQLLKLHGYRTQSV